MSDRPPIPAKTYKMLRAIVLLRGYHIEYLEQIVYEKYGGNITDKNLDQFLDEVMKN